jgi:hypothetical protein
MNDLPMLTVKLIPEICIQIDRAQNSADTKEAVRAYIEGARELRELFPYTQFLRQGSTLILKIPIEALPRIRQWAKSHNYPCVPQAPTKYLVVHGTPKTAHTGIEHVTSFEVVGEFDEEADAQVAMNSYFEEHGGVIQIVPINAFGAV